jgi:sugar lactone lactonase YvrE
MIVDDKVPRPNGLTLTNDGKTLIVDDTLNPTVFAYDVQPDGSVKNKRTFAQLVDIPAGSESGADGLAIDRDDRVYITTVAGVQVFDKTGKHLGTIKTDVRARTSPSPAPTSARSTSRRVRGSTASGRWQGPTGRQVSGDAVVKPAVRR